MNNASTNAYVSPMNMPDTRDRTCADPRNHHPCVINPFVELTNIAATSNIESQASNWNGEHI